MIRVITNYFVELMSGSRQGWNRFWFQPTDPATLGMIRILTGWMLVYTHSVWTLGLDRFLSNDGMLSNEFIQQFHGSSFAWSYLYWIDSPALLWTVHLLGLLVLLSFMVGYQTRWTGILAFAITTAYSNRAVTGLFGLDQVVGFLTFYLAVGPSGSAFSVDRWLRRRDSANNKVTPSIGANVSIRLIQVHMCVVYFFAATGKLQGETWWTGEALWGAVANYEYQTIDLTFLAGAPLVINLLTHVTIFWELSYCALVWPRLTRPLVIALAIPLHLGIAFGMGMITFGYIMLVGNFAFVAPSLVRRCVGAISRQPQLKPEPTAAAHAT